MIIVTTKHGSQATFETAQDAARFCNDLHKERTARRLGKSVPVPRCDAYDSMPERCNAYDALHADGACDGSRPEPPVPTYEQLSKVADAARAFICASNESEVFDGEYDALYTALKEAGR